MNTEQEKVIIVQGSTGGDVVVPVPVLRPCKIKSAKIIAENTITEITCAIKYSTNVVMSGAISTGSTVVELARNATYGQTKFDPASDTATLTYMNLVVPQQNTASKITFVIEFDYGCASTLD